MPFLQLGAPKIYVPNALPMYREDLPGRPLSKKRRAEKEAEDRKYQPAPGSMAQGEGGWVLLWEGMAVVGRSLDGVAPLLHCAPVCYLACNDVDSLHLALCFASAGVGAGGQLGATGGTLLTQHVLKQQGGLANAEVDARAAFLRHANKTDDEMSRFTAAYKCAPRALGL